jgi:imidazolonepropionase-like amidohydrolase
MDAAIRVLVGAGVPVAAALAAAGPVPAALLGVAEDAGEVELDPDGRLVRVRIGATGAYAR